MSAISTAAASTDHRQCTECGTELAPHALACPACQTLVHGRRLAQLAAFAEQATGTGDLPRAREAWQNALRLLPPDSQQSAVIRDRVAELTTRIDAATPESEKKPKPTDSWWRRGAAGVVTFIVLLLGKLKFLILGLTKASTFLSMFAFFGVYWGLYGWPLALGLVVSIYIHEMGHVSRLKRFGIAASAPMFIPGLGALVLLKQHVDDPVVDADVGLAGPVWGLGAALAAFGVFEVSHARVWLAIAELAAFINLFNLIPFWQLDGSRGFHALSQRQRWTVVLAVVIALLLTEQRMLILIGAVAVWRSLQREAGPGNGRVLATFIALIGALSWLARTVH